MSSQALSSHTVWRRFCLVIHAAPVDNLNQAVFPAVLLSGILLLVASFAVARVNWRPDMPLYSLKTRSTDVLLHPAKYVQPQALRLTRILQLLGGLLLLVAILALARQFVHDFGH